MALRLLGLVLTLIRWGLEQYMAKHLGAGRLAASWIFLAAMPAVSLAAGNAATSTGTGAASNTNALKADARTEEVASGKFAMALAAVACAGFVASRRQPRP